MQGRSILQVRTHYGKGFYPTPLEHRGLSEPHSIRKISHSLNKCGQHEPLWISWLHFIGSRLYKLLHSSHPPALQLPYLYCCCTSMTCLTRAVFHKKHCIVMVIRFLYYKVCTQMWPPIIIKCYTSLSSTEPIRFNWFDNMILKQIYLLFHILIVVFILYHSVTAERNCNTW